MRRMVILTEHPMPPLREVIRIYEGMATIIEPSKVVAVAANTCKLSEAEAERVVRRTEEELGIVTADLIRQGPGRIVEAILDRHAELGLEAPSAAPQEPRSGRSSTTWTSTERPSSRTTLTSG